MISNFSGWRSANTSTASVISPAEVALIGAEARVEAARFADGDADPNNRLCLWVLSAACRIWSDRAIPTPLSKPKPPTSSSEFAADLISQMTTGIAHAGSPFYSENLEAAFQSMARVCSAIAQGRPSVLVAENAFFTGLLVGEFYTTRSEIDQIAWRAYQKSLDIESRRDLTRKKKSEEADLALVRFAQSRCETDPYVSNAALQRGYRQAVGKGETTESNNEARAFARLRREGRLPGRAIVKNS